MARLWHKFKRWLLSSELEEVREDLAHLSSKLMLLHVGQQSQALTLSQLIARKHDIEAISNDLDAAKRIIANAIQNIDIKLNDQEELINFLFEKLTEHESKIINLENRATQEDFKQLQLTASDKSTEN